MEIGILHHDADAIPFDQSVKTMRHPHPQIPMPGEPAGCDSRVRLLRIRREAESIDIVLLIQKLRMLGIFFQEREQLRTRHLRRSLRSAHGDAVQAVEEIKAKNTEHPAQLLQRKRHRLSPRRREVITSSAGDERHDGDPRQLFHAEPLQKKRFVQ